MSANIRFLADGDEFALNVDVHTHDGVTIAVWHWNGDDWMTLYDRRIIGDDLEDSINIALYGAKAFVEGDVDRLSPILAGRVRKHLAA